MVTTVVRQKIRKREKGKGVTENNNSYTRVEQQHSTIKDRLSQTTEHLIIIKTKNTGKLEIIK